MKALDRLESPSQSLAALGRGQHDQFSIRREDQSGAGIGQLDAIASGLLDAKLESLLYCLLVQAGFDVHIILKKDIGGLQDVFVLVDRKSHMMESATAVG